MELRGSINFTWKEMVFISISPQSDYYIFFHYKIRQSITVVILESACDFFTNKLKIRYFFFLFKVDLADISRYLKTTVLIRSAIGFCYLIH